MQRIAVVPGSFDPVTLGHLDVIGRAAGLYDELHVVVVHNPDKDALLPIAQRVSLIERSIADAGIEGRIVVSSWSMGLLVDYCTDVGASVLVKGIRSQVDVDFATGLISLEGVLRARERFGNMIDVEIVAFPQEGIVTDPKAPDLLREDVVHPLGGSVLHGSFLRAAREFPGRPPRGPRRRRAQRLCSMRPVGSSNGVLGSSPETRKPRDSC